MSNKPEHSRKKVCYYYDGNIGQYYYGQGHPMKPHRITMTHSLVLNYGMYKSMHILKPPRLPAEEMTTYHSDDYINLLKNLTGNEVVDNKYAKEMYKYNIGNECPAFEGLFEFCQISAGGSVQAAKHLNKGTYDIGINWAGGLHHAKTSEAAGFCYVNDVVLAILELLKVHQRVLYIDIDIHHGDGVEEAFYTTDRVMTLSFHQYGHHFFPATGVTSDFGAGKGRYYSVNVPLGIGIDDESFESIFNPVVTRVMEMYRPNAIVMQCGADSLAGDRLGSFNLTVHGHGKCVSFVKKYEFPLLLLGGGGYKLPTVARTWAYETAVAVSKEKDISNILPFNDYYEYYGPEFKLQITPSNMINQNSKESLDRLTSEVFDNLRMLSFAPSVQFQPIPNDAVTSKIQKLVKDKYDEPRITQSHAHLVQDNEYSDSEDEGDERRDKSNYTYGSNKNNATIGDTSSEVDQTIQDSVDETKDQIMEDNANEVPIQKMEEIAYTAVIAFLEGSCASESESEDFSPTLEFTADVAEPLLMLGDIKRMGDFKYEPGNQTEDDYEDSNQTLKGTNEASNINKQSVDHLTNEAVNLIVKNTVSEASNQYLRNTTNEAFNCNAGNQTQMDTSEASIINKQSGHHFTNGAISLNVKDAVSEASNQYLENAANETCSQSIQIQGSGNGASTSRITVEEANSKDSLNQITPLTTISKLPGEKDEDDPKASSKSQNECKDEARSYRMSDLMELLANSGPGVEDNTITFSSEVTEGEMSSLGVPAIIAGPETGEGNYAAFEGTSTPQQGLSYIDTLDLENISDEEFF